MIKESSRMPRLPEEDDYQIVDIDQPMHYRSDDLMEYSSDNSMDYVSNTTFLEEKTSYFFIELLVCSVLIWSLLFIKNTEFATMIKNTLQQEIQNPTVHELIQEVEDTLKQVF